MTPSDEDLKYACENVDGYRFPKIEFNGTIYKNKFCSVCNSIKTQVINSCHVSSNLTVLLNKTCQEFPKIAVCSNYRNIFCEMCDAGASSYCLSIDEEDGGGGRTSPSTGRPPPIIVPLFRSMFSILAFDQKPVTRKALFCPPEQIYDEYYVSVAVKN